MRQTTLDTTDRTTTDFDAYVPGLAPARTTGGLVAATLVPAVVVAAYVAPLATLTAAAVLVTFAVAMAVTDGEVRPDGDATDDRGGGPTPPDGVAAD
ncbi:hypothetical protein BRD00_06595 [Halobacteriales archaeon QS_8_69_26]|nr:MAG: hypothetical protein BRD00_06595 [Halobacteriales archaeon QS_8_69_26]